MSTKQEKILKLSRCIFTLEAKCGHLKWKVTDLEKSSGVSRSLIYRYLGGRKEEIFHNGFKIFIHEFYGFENSEQNQSFLDKIHNAKTLMQKYSDAIIFYQKWRVTEAKLSGDFVSIELKFQKKLKSLFPEVKDENIPILHAFIHGLVTSPFLSPDQAIAGLMLLQKLRFFGKTKVEFI